MTVKVKLVEPLKLAVGKIGRESCREGVRTSVDAASLKKKLRKSGPLAGSGVTVTDEMVTSMSVPLTLTAIVVSSLPLTVPGAAVGASLTEATLSVSVAATEVAP